MTFPVKVIVKMENGETPTNEGVAENVTGVTWLTSGALPLISHRCATVPRLRPVVVGNILELKVPIYDHPKMFKELAFRPTPIGSEGNTLSVNPKSSAIFMRVSAAL